MSTSAILSSNFLNYDNQTTQNRMQQFQQEFQQLGEDLQSGNLTAAQQDFATLQQLGPQGSSTSAQSSNPITQEFSQLGQDLQSGNLAAAQQDYSNIQQDFQNQTAQAHGHHHHHHGGGGGEGNAISQLLNQLGQALQSGNLSSAQQTYNSLLEDFQQIGGEVSGQLSAQSSTNSISVSA
jgi:hypothetical protein